METYSSLPNPVFNFDTTPQFILGVTAINFSYAFQFYEIYKLQARHLQCK